MKSTGSRRLGLLVALACALAHPALSTSLGASALTLGFFAAHLHGHSLQLQSDGDHFDVVLSHDDAHEPQSPHRSYDHGDHVVHVGASDTASTSSRRLQAEHVSPSEFAAAPLPPARPARTPGLWFEPRARGLERLRTVVLRL